MARPSPSRQAFSVGENAQIEPSKKLVWRSPIHRNPAEVFQNAQARGPTYGAKGNATKNVASVSSPANTALSIRSHVPSSSSKVRSVG